MLSGWGVGVSRRRRLHPCHAASVGFGATPQGVNKPLGGRVVGGMCQRHSFKGLSFYSYEQPGTRCSEYTDAACGAKARQLANSPHRLLNYFQMLVQGLSMPLS